jgi:uncharacterized membrane protein
MDDLPGLNQMPPEQPAAQPAPQPAAPATSSAGFDFNQPTIISLLYLSSFVLGVTALVGVVLAFVWKDQPKAAWEASHYQYLINTFWIGLIGSVIGFLLLIVLIGFFVLLAVAALVVVRSVLSLINAQKQMPMPKPDTWLA